MSIRPGGRAGIREVAQRAEVSVSSVSRVITDHPDVSAAMRERVQAAIAALGYEPDILAQSLRRGSTRTIGFLVSDISNPLYSEIALSAERVLNEAGYAMLIANSRGAADRDAIQLRLLSQRRVDGFILSLSDETDPKTIAQLKALECPFVLLDREVGAVKTAAVLSNHAEGIRAAAMHLLHLGHSRIGFIGGNQSARPTRVRRDTLLQVAREHRGVRIYVEDRSFTAAHGEAGASALLDRAAPPTALIAGGNQILVGILRVIRRRGLRVPADLSLVTCDRVPLSEFLVPPLATLERDHHQMGQVAAEHILGILAGKPPATQYLPVTFDPKESCGPPGAERQDTRRKP